MSVLYAILTALLQGVTEFLPVSSTGHLAVVSNLAGMPEDINVNLLFIAFLHLGTLIAVLFSFRRELRTITTDVANVLRGNDDAASNQPAPTVRMAFLVAVATAPLLLAIPFYGAIRMLFSSTPFIGVMMAASGALLYASSKYVKGGTKTARTFTLTDALIVGAAQLVAFIPGLSRVAATVTVALTRGADRDFAVKYSYFMSIPAIVGTIIATFIGALVTRSFAGFSVCLLGMIISAVVGIFSIGLLRIVMNKDKFVSFSYYNVIAGTIIIILSLIF